MAGAEQFDVAIVGGGPAGLSAAITLGRSRRDVVIFDHGKPRNFAATAVHCFLGMEGLSPATIRERGRQEAEAYGVSVRDVEVVRIECVAPDGNNRTAFTVHTKEATFNVRAILLATGVIDQLPDLPGLKECYGQSVHHCPYCDGWEHRDQRLVALGQGHAVVELGTLLRGWSEDVTVCSNGDSVSAEDVALLQRNAVAYRGARILRLESTDKLLTTVCFADGTSLGCDALFFSSGQGQRSNLPAMLGCECDDEGLIVSGKKQCTNIRGVYLAGDADGEVQFAIAAAAEGAVAAIAINAALHAEDLK